MGLLYLLILILAVEQCSEIIRRKNMKLQIKSFCSIKAGYSFRGQPVADETGPFYLLQAKDINAFGEIDYHQCIKISTDNIKSITPLSQGEILLTARGTFKAAIFESDKPFVTSNAVFIIDVMKPACYKPYLAIWLNSPACKKQLEKVTLLSATTPTLPRNALNELEIDLPSLDKQKEIVEAYRLNSKQYAISQSIYNLRKMQLENMMNGAII